MKSLWIILFTMSTLLCAETPEQTARRVMEDFFRAWNTGEDAELRKVQNFPFITIGANGRASVAMKAEEFTQNFPALRQNESWARSTLDSVKVLPVEAPDKLHIVVTYSRYKADGSKYMTGETFYILTKQDGRWGMQLRSTLSQRKP
jgi:hypothetical protein